MGKDDDGIPPVRLDLTGYYGKDRTYLGCYGVARFYSDDSCRRLTDKFRHSGNCGKYLDDRYWVVRGVRGDYATFVLYDRMDETLLFDSTNIPDMDMKIGLFLAVDDTHDIVQLAKRCRTE